MSFINDYFRSKYNERIRKKLTNTSFSLICNNCNGASILHDLGMRFNSSFVNLCVESEDFLKILSQLRYYLAESTPLTENKQLSEKKGYPVGNLDDVVIHFMHYKTFENALLKWKERCKRVDYNNLFILMTEKDDCSFEIIKKFDALPFEHKVMLCKKNYPTIHNSYKMKCMESLEGKGVLLYYTNKLTHHKYYDEFDFVSWFNTGEIPRK